MFDNLQHVTIKLMKKVGEILWILLLLPFTGISQTTFYATCENNALIYADFQNCSYQTICSTGFTMLDIALTPNEALYTTDGKKVYFINKYTCSNITVTPTDVPDADDFISSLVALDNDYLFAVSHGAKLFKIDVVDGSSILIDTLKQELNDSTTLWFGSGGDLTWFKNDLYLATKNNDLVKITLNKDYNDVTSIILIGHMSTPYGSVYGISSIGESNCETDNIQMLAFEGQDIYLVNPKNASIQMQCDSIFPCVVFGAASLTETKNQDLKSEFDLPNVFTPNNDYLNDFYYPLIIKNILSIDIKIYNKWGNLIFSERDTTFKWDGININGNICSEGTYYYLIEVTDICNNKEVKKGFLTLLR